MTLLKKFAEVALESKRSKYGEQEDFLEAPHTVWRPHTLRTHWKLWAEH
jgi:hypothetical protein